MLWAWASGCLGQSAPQHRSCSDHLSTPSTMPHAVRSGMRTTGYEQLRCGATVHHVTACWRVFGCQSHRPPKHHACLSSPAAGPAHRTGPVHATSMHLLARTCRAVTGRKSAGTLTHQSQSAGLGIHPTRARPTSAGTGKRHGQEERRGLGFGVQGSAPRPQDVGTGVPRPRRGSAGCWGKPQTAGAACTSRGCSPAQPPSISFAAALDGSCSLRLQLFRPRSSPAPVDSMVSAAVS